MPFKQLTKLKNWCRGIWQKYYAVQPLAQAITEYQSWFNSSLGKALVKEQQKTLDEILPCLFGYHLMQLSVIPEINLSGESKINHQFSLFTNESTTASNNAELKVGVMRASALANFERLPIEPESIDVAIVHHALDFSTHPHQLLREVSKTIIPHGYLIIVGFNPFSWLGLIKPFARLLCCNPIWRRHSLRKSRIEDWLRLLDFEVLKAHHGFFRLPLNYDALLKYGESIERIGQRVGWPFGSYYILVARNDVLGMTPINPKWKRLGNRAMLPVVNGANRYRN